MLVWEEYNNMGEEKNTKIKTYKAQKEFFVKEIYFNNNEDKINKYAALESMKNEINIYKIYEEDFKFNVVIDKDTEASEKFDAILNNNIELKNESIIKENGKYSKFKEIKKIHEKGEKK